MSPWRIMEVVVALALYGVCVMIARHLVGVTQ